MVEEEAHERLTFFTPHGNWRWRVIPMGSLNAVPAFVAMTVKLKMEWATLYKERRLKMLHQK